MFKSLILIVTSLTVLTKPIIYKRNGIHLKEGKGKRTSPNPKKPLEEDSHGRTYLKVAWRP